MDGEEEKSPEPLSLPDCAPEDILLGDLEAQEDTEVMSIANKGEIFSEIDKAIFDSYSPELQEKTASPKPPDVEYLFVEPFGSFRIWGSMGFGINPYGHAAVRYTIPGTNEQKVVNISGTQNDNLVNFYTPEEYLFENVDKVDQGGIWNRNIVSVRIENVEEWQIEDMDHYFRRLHRRNKKHYSAKFSIIFSPIYNVLRWLGNISGMAERGNCAYFTSSGLAEGCLMTFPTLWPKKIWIELFEKQKEKQSENVHVVYYRRNPNQRGLKYGVDVKYLPFTGVAPLSPVRSFMYRDLERFADVVVEVPEGSDKAVICTPQSAPLQESKIRYYSGTALAVLGIGVVLFSARGRRSVKKGVDNTQEQLKHARELVRLVKEQRAQLKQAKQKK